jgi:serine/threonine protein phosphatase PrpC
VDLAALSRALDADAAAAAAAPPGAGRDAGAAALVALLRRGVLTVANAGDCRAVLCGRGGAAVDLSTDHKPSLPAEARRIAEAGAFVADGRVNGSLALSRALGDHEYKRAQGLPPSRQAVTALPDVRSYDLRAAGGVEFILLACDGIWDVMSSQQAVDFVRSRLAAGGEAASLTAVAAALCDACTAADTGGTGLGCDNMSVLIVVPKPAALCGGGGGGAFAMQDVTQAHAHVHARSRSLSPPMQSSSPTGGRSGGGGVRAAAAAAAAAARAAAAAAAAGGGGGGGRVPLHRARKAACLADGR